jgi:hypothetical protein
MEYIKPLFYSFLHPTSSTTLQSFVPKSAARRSMSAAGSSLKSSLTSQMSFGFFCFAKSILSGAVWAGIWLHRKNVGYISLLAPSPESLLLKATVGCPPSPLLHQKDRMSIKCRFSLWPPRLYVKHHKLRVSQISSCPKAKSSLRNTGLDIGCSLLSSVPRCYGLGSMSSASSSSVNKHVRRLLLCLYRSAGHKCERPIGTVFQLPSPDTIYSRDEEKKRSVGGYPVWFGLARGPHALGSRGYRRKEATRQGSD